MPVYVTAAESTPRPGVHIAIGTPAPEYWQQVLWRCDRGRCTRCTLDAFDTTTGHERLAAGPDGHVLIVREDRIPLVWLSACR